MILNRLAQGDRFISSQGAGALSAMIDAQVGKPTIMIVDDSQQIRQVNCSLLRAHGYFAVEAEDGFDAKEILTLTKPDLILFDVEMPRMNGFELATHVRQMDDIKAIPMIMMTSRTGVKYRARSESLGVNCYLGKPFKANQLLMLIRRLLDPNRF